MSRDSVLEYSDADELQDYTIRLASLGDGERPDGDCDTRFLRTETIPCHFISGVLGFG